MFFQDVGEEAVTDDFVQTYLMEAVVPSAVMQLAQKYNGLAVMAEHRFYGKSLPFPIDPTTGIAPAGWDAYKYLTTEQALEDVVYLAEHFQPTGLEQYWTQLQPSQTPWIFLGGSYPGARAAWIRLRNPDVIYASWASSAPVQTTVDMSTYYEQVYTDMTANCSADMAMASQYLTNVLTSGSDRDKALVRVLSNIAQAPRNITQYLGKSDAQIETSSQGANVTDFGVAENLANFIGAGLQSYGFSAALQPFCTAVEKFNPTEISNSSISSIISGTFENSYNNKPTARGIGATYGPQAAYLALMWGIAVETAASPDSITVGEVEQALADGMSWTWQTCLEFGYFQIANASSPDNLLSTFVNESSWADVQCHQPFPYSPDRPNVSALVNKYGGWNMNPSQVMFTDGLKDPWHTLSVQSTSSEIGAPNRQTTQTVPDCGKSADGTSVFGLTYADEYHVSDLLGGTNSFEDGLALFEKAMDTWIPCFQKHSITSNSTTSSTTPMSSPPSGTTGSASSSPSGKNAASAVSANAQLGGLAALVAMMLIL